LEHVVRPTKNLHGIVDAVEVVLKLTGASIPLISAFLVKKSKNPVGKRRVIIDGQRRVFENMSADEVTAILSNLHDGPS
jgi:hypothetical protein